MPRVAAIGLDAAEPTLVDRLVREGQMPTVARLRARGATATLTNTEAYRAEAAYTTLLTGLRPATSRYWSTVDFDPQTYRAFGRGAHRAAPFYARDDIDVIAFDLPHAHLAEDVNGVQITAWGAHSPQFPRTSDPAGLLTRIDERFGRHPAFNVDSESGWYNAEYHRRLSDALAIGSHRRAAISDFLAHEEHPSWDLFLTVMSETHTAGHQYWYGIDHDHPLSDHHARDVAREHLVRGYREVDAAVGRLVDALDDDVIVVLFAAHGMQANAGDVAGLVLLPELLLRLGTGHSLLVPPGARRWDGAPVVLPPEQHLWEHLRRSRRERVQLPPGAPFASRWERLAASVWNRAPSGLRGRRTSGSPWWALQDRSTPEAPLRPGEPIGEDDEIAWQPPQWYRRYWPAMRWFALPAFSDGHVRINLEGRERDGVVPRDEYERACDEVEAAVRALRNPRTGNPIVGEVVRMRSDDPYAPDGPDADLVIVFDEVADAVDHPVAGRIGPFPFMRTGEHSPDGWVCISGPNIARAKLGNFEPVDVAPTLLSLLGRSIPEPLEGRPMLASLPT